MKIGITKLKNNIMKSGIELITAERQDQIEKHSFDKSHDNNEAAFNLSNAAVFVLTQDEAYFPKEWEGKWRDKFRAKTYKERLVTAGALLAAEIDKLNG
jgi:hypothetical protein